MAAGTAVTAEQWRAEQRRRRDQLRAAADDEQAKLSALFVVNEAEGVVGSTRITELHEAYAAARRRIPAARGRLTRAQRGGDPAAVAAARAHLDEVQRDADRTGDAAISESQEIIRAGLDRSRGILDQIGPTWDARAAVTDTFRDGS